MSEEKKYDVDVDAEVTVSEITDEPNPPEPEPGPEPGPPSGDVAPPGSTGGKVTDITNSTGLGLNVVGGRPQSFSDYTSEGTYDSAVLLGPGEGGSSFTRFQLRTRRASAAGPATAATRCTAKART